MKTSKIWRPDLGQYVDVDAAIVQKVKETAKIRNDAKERMFAELEKQYPGRYTQQLQQSFFQRVNIIEFLFKLFVFIFIALPLTAFGIAIMWWSFGMGFVCAVLIMFVLVILCYLSQVPAKELSLNMAIGTFIKAIVMTPIALIGSFFVTKAPKGTAVAGGIVTDMVRDAGEIIDKAKRL